MSDFTNLKLAPKMFVLIISALVEGSHSGLVRAPAKRLGGEIPLMGSNPIPSAILVGVLNLIMLVRSEYLSYLDYRLSDE